MIHNVVTYLLTVTHGDWQQLAHTVQECRKTIATCKGNKDEGGMTGTRRGESRRGWGVVGVAPTTGDFSKQIVKEMVCAYSRKEWREREGRCYGRDYATKTKHRI